VIRVLGILLGACAALAGSLVAPGPVTGPAAAARPSIVVILTDDQRADGADRMPVVRARLAAQGVVFGNAFVSNPLCCPSRTTLLTGRYSHTTSVWNNRPRPLPAAELARA
jgi:arylsulfatase A-like enzyme